VIAITLTTFGTSSTGGSASRSPHFCWRESCGDPSARQTHASPTGVPWTRSRFKLVIEDVRSLLRFRVPDHPTHVGLSGLLQALGLLLFLWLGVSGSSNAIAITPGVKLTGWLRVIKHWHQIGNVLVPAYSILHVGGTVAHSLAGKQVWKKMLFLELDLRPPSDTGCVCRSV